MKERKGDARIYLISAFFFVCVVCGGVVLGLYIFLPETFSQSWYPVAGMLLVGIPWIFWLFAYLYRCFLPTTSTSTSTNNNNFNASTSTPSSRTPGTAVAAASEEEDQSPVSPGRHVHFGAVVVMGSKGNKSQESAQCPESDKGESSSSPHEKASRECEIPLAFS
ncbi:hypothetical protein Ddye_026304 [Dipteronia dyeriana]|uniref:Uncharacterized protein n=1 Tax=Dipteronia dyeriana TaxID=168575 RepID=A0AAD9TMW7_9ROSI|nr:hypothetical protein Ddye_026304 [Dipteronia dyeriana]